jgi:thiol-disulfide isomerase/thioredoxin
MAGKLKYILIAVLGLLAALFFYNKYRVAPGVDFNKLALFDVEGKPVKWTDFEGKKMVVSFGASWCPNCLDELKLINSIKEKELTDVEIIVISDEELKTVQAFKGRKNYSFTFLKMNQTFNSIGVNAIPTIYILNTKLEVKDETVGYIDWHDLSTVEHLRKLME